MINCKFEGCQEKFYGLGYCRKHYRRFKIKGYADFTKPKTLSLIESALQSETEECINWPFSDNGKDYGKLKIDDKYFYAHRYILSLTTAEDYDNPLQTAHSCNNTRCINPKHLRWDTPVGNNLDKIENGTLLKWEEHPNAKLSGEKVKEIRSLAGVVSYPKIAEKYNISTSHVERIINKKRWKDYE